MKVHQVGDGVFMLTGTEVNWTILREGDDLTLVDGGYPGDASQVVESIRSIGNRIEDLRAVLVTHAHVDHIGGLPELRRQTSVPVFAHRLELPQLRGESHEQASTVDG